MRGIAAVYRLVAATYFFDVGVRIWKDHVDVSLRKVKA